MFFLSLCLFFHTLLANHLCDDFSFDNRLIKTKLLQYVYEYMKVFEGISIKSLLFQCEQVLHALKAAAIGIGVLDGAVKTVSGIIGDMDTTIMFASAGTLNADNDGEEFAGNV